MIDQKKIMLMSRLAVYDKGQGQKDREIASYFQHDYVYKQNFWTRLFIFISWIILSINYVLYKIYIEQIDIFVLDLKAEATKLLYWLVVMLVIYTIVSGIKANIEYYDAERRLKNYHKLLEKLD